MIASTQGWLRPADIIFEEQEVTGEFDLAVISPGIAPTSSLFESARACATELIGEPELAWRISPERWIGITGTNGKTTTTCLLGHVLVQCGIPALVAGNIGLPCIDAIQLRQPGEYLVAELSSFQLASAFKLKPDAAILLNITPDHLGWHGGFESYVRDKRRIFYHMDPEAPAVIDATMDTTRELVLQRRQRDKRVIPLGTADGLSGDMTIRCGAEEAAFVDAATGRLTVILQGQRHELLKADELQIKGEHNQENALAAAAVALALGAEAPQVCAALASFQPLEHRIEPAGTVDGVEFFNDSKATNPEATLKALSAFTGRPLILLLGGRDKNTPLDELVAAAVPACKAVICYGEAGGRFAEAFLLAHDRSVLLVPGFQQAFDTAVEMAEPGDVVLLSPACASFDEFGSFEQRGAAFKGLVCQLQAQQPAEGVQ
jgi:UDP-N-acetylmuramoylalanine--D-glutamate ligase